MTEPALPDPGTARNAAEFAALLRELRRRSGLTYRELEKRAAQHGEVLARSTLAAALRHDLLPRPELLVAYLVACGQRHDIGRWLSARARIAAVAPEETLARAPSEPPRQVGAAPGPNRSAARRKRLRRPAAMVSLLVLVLGWIIAADQVGERLGGAAVDATPGAPAPVAPGTYRIRSTDSGLCLSEPDGEDSGGRVQQSNCDGSVPTYLLEPAGGGQHLIRTLHPVFGRGCLGVAGGSVQDGTQLMHDYCGRRGTGERFRLEPSGAPQGGFRIRPVHTGACVTVPGGTRTPGARVLQLACAAGTPVPGSGQTFALDAVPAPTPIPDITTN
ncbi:RICIN domain-containing protein [Streptomyces sp. NPDC003042]